MTNYRKQTRSQEFANRRLAQLAHMGEDERDAEVAIKALEATPEAWSTIEMDIICEEPREKVTLYLDRSVARMFRKMGKGYHRRINRILMTWAQLHVTGYKRELRGTLQAASPQFDEEDAYYQETKEIREKMLRRLGFFNGLEAGRAEFRKEAVEKGWVVIPEGE